MYYNKWSTTHGNGNVQSHDQGESKLNSIIANSGVHAVIDDKLMKSRFNKNKIAILKTKFLTVSSYHVTYAFQSESTLYSCLNVKELLARSRREIWNLSDCNWTRTHNHLVHKRTFNHLAKLAKWLSCEYLSVRCIWLYLLIMSRTRFRVNPHSIVAWMSRNSLLEAGAKSEI